MTRLLLPALMLLAACSAPKEATREQPAAAASPTPPAQVAQKPQGAQRMQYPATRAEPIVDTLHGVQVADPYRWLEDEKAPEVQAWMKAQDALTREQLSKVAGRDALAKRFRELFYVDSISAPV